MVSENRSGRLWWLQKRTWPLLNWAACGNPRNPGEMEMGNLRPSAVPLELQQSCAFRKCSGGQEGRALAAHYFLLEEESKPLRGKRERPVIGEMPAGAQ